VYQESITTATYTFDVFSSLDFSSLDGYGAHSGNWGGYWGKQGPSCSSAPQRYAASRAAGSSPATKVCAHCCCSVA
jgi:hypothetical protein